MASNIGFFAVHADDLPRARRFYETVFGWKFRPWGPPGFFLIATGDEDNPGIEGALQSATRSFRANASIATNAPLTSMTSTRPRRPSRPTAARSFFPNARFPRWAGSSRFRTRKAISCASSNRPIGHSA